MQVLNIELIDISEVTISGAFFYEAALKFKDELKLNGIYKISQGTISNESYANSRNDKLSPFRLIFNVNSVFEEVSDVNIIANPEDSAITLAELLDKNMLGQEFSVIAILVKIEDPFELPKS